MEFKRPQYQELERNIKGNKVFIQVLTGPRQVGKGGLSFEEFLTLNPAELF